MPRLSLPVMARRVRATYRGTHLGGGPDTPGHDEQGVTPGCRTNAVVKSATSPHRNDVPGARWNAMSPPLLTNARRHRAPLDHCRQDRIRDRAGDGGHRRDETIGERRAGGVHGPGYPARPAAGEAARTQQGQFRAKVVQDASEKRGRLPYAARTSAGSPQALHRQSIGPCCKCSRPSGSRAATALIAPESPYRRAASQTAGGASAARPRGAAPARYGRPAERSRPAAG